jgi:tRNA-specific 2-thiouridylase
MAQDSKKVFVGMSGGVDSSVSALLLKQAGYDVTGVFIKVWQADFLPCSWREERREAMRAAAHIGIPFATLDLEQEYKSEVVDYMIAEYGKGRIPNPDVMCNKYVKFGAFLAFAKKHGADFIATGHYAQINVRSGVPVLQNSVDTEKDQTYFLWTLGKDVLPSVLFPIGHLQKSAVRAIAKEAGLPNAEKKDSQGLCFMGPVNMEDFLKHFLKTKKGEVLDQQGNTIGEHEGAILYTVGQRHGFSTTKTSAHDLPYFVQSKNMDTNTITVTHDDPRTSTGRVSSFWMSDTQLPHMLDGEQSECSVRIRYRGDLHPAQIEKKAGLTLVTLTHPIEDIAMGQSAVFYQDDCCIGGGVITEGV